MKNFARPVPVDGAIRMMQVFDVDAINPRPPWGQTDDELLSRIFANQKAAWVNDGTWFVQVPDLVQDGAIHTGSDYSDLASYLNPDGTTAEPPPPPEEP